MSRFHILMVLDHRFPPDIRVENEARSLLAAGFAVSLLSIAPYPDAGCGFSQRRGVKIIRVHLPQQLHKKMRGLAASVPALSLLVSRQIQRVCRRQHVDALHMHDLWLFGGGLRASQRLGIPVVGDLHENHPDALTQYAWSTRFPGKYFVNIPRWRYLEAKWGREVDRLICVNDPQKARMVRHGVDPDKVAVVPNTIDISEFEAHEVDEEIISSLRSPFTVVYTGSFDLHRGLPTLIRAMVVVLRQQEARLVLVGDGSIRSELESLVKSLGIGDHVAFMGWQPQNRIKSYILGSDVGAVPLVKGPHTDAATPHKLFHYMFFKKPVLATNCQLIQQVVETTQAGVVVPSESPEEMGEALLALARDPELRIKMGEGGHQAVVSRYNWDVTAQGMVSAYRELAGS